MNILMDEAFHLCQNGQEKSLLTVLYRMLGGDMLEHFPLQVFRFSDKYVAMKLKFDERDALPVQPNGLIVSFSNGMGSEDR